MMGANEQILSPAAEKLDQFVALGSGGQYANYQEQAQTAPDTSGVSSAGAITGGMDSQRGLTSSNLGQHQKPLEFNLAHQLVAYLLKHFQVTMGASMLKMKLERGIACSFLW